MAEFEFFISKSLELKLVDYILSLGACFVPDIRYDRPEYFCINDKNNYIKYRKKTTLFFILHDSYTKCFLEMRTVKKETIKYFIMQRNGGPSIDFVRCVEYEEKEQQFIASGYIGYYPIFWNTLMNINEKAPESQKIMYRKLCNYIKTSAKRLKTEHRVYWIDNTLLERIKSKALNLVGVPESSIKDFILSNS